MTGTRRSHLRSTTKLAPMRFRVFMVRARGNPAAAAAHSDSHPTPTHRSTPAPGPAPAGPACVFSAALPRSTGSARPRRSLHRDLQVRRDRIEVERLAHERAQRHHEFVRVDGMACHKLPHRTIGQADLLLRTEQDDVG